MQRKTTIPLAWSAPGAVDRLRLRAVAGRLDGRLGPIIDLAALGLVNASWRHTCVEDWHAGGRMHDGDMMRVNSHMTWRARQILRRWMAENGLAADGPLSALDGVPAQDIEWLAVWVFRWLVNPPAADCPGSAQSK